MRDFITLTCPSCNGNLQVGANTSVLNCQHCGNEHLVRREGGAVTLESFARCSQCGRNDRVEKVSAIYKYQTGSVILNSMLAPPEKHRLFAISQESLPPIKLPPKPIPKYLPEKKEYHYYFMAYGLAFIVFSLISFPALFNFEMASISIFIFTTGVLLIIFSSMTKKRQASQYKKALRDRNKANDSAMQLWNQSVEEVKTLYRQEKLQFEKAYSIEVARRDKASVLWEQLYYCHRDDCIFIPGNGTFAPVEKMCVYLNDLISE